MNKKAGNNRKTYGGVSFSIHLMKKKEIIINKHCLIKFIYLCIIQLYKRKYVYIIVSICFFFSSFKCHCVCKRGCYLIIIIYHYCWFYFSQKKTSTTVYHQVCVLYANLDSSGMKISSDDSGKVYVLLWYNNNECLNFICSIVVCLKHSW